MTGEMTRLHLSWCYSLLFIQKLLAEEAKNGMEN